jgi:hypothetical protein
MKVRKYDATRQAYCDVEVDDLQLEMEVMGFDEETVTPKIEEKKEEVMTKVAELLGVEDVVMTEADGKITVEANKEGSIKAEIAEVARLEAEKAELEAQPIEEVKE